MLKKLLLFYFTLLNITFVAAQDQTPAPVLYSIEPVIHIGQIVKNAPQAPKSNTAFVYEVNFSIQTSGKREWNDIFGFPKAGCSVFFGGLGNKKELGSIFGLLPNMTFNSINPKWYVPRINLGLGIAYFNNPYDEQKNTTNYYIGSAITALGFASLYIQPRLNNFVSLKMGVSVLHCSNGHVQIPNLGINLPGIFTGFICTPKPIPPSFAKNNITLPKSSIHFGIRAGMGVHQLAKTTEPIGTPKYAVYITDLYLSKFYGKFNNVQVGLELKHYNSYYNYIKTNNFYTQNQKLKATVASVFIAHELMINKISILSQGGINIYSPFYPDYIKQFKSQRGFQTELKKYISTRLGLQYYLRNPKYCSRSNVFIGTYIKANFGQADFICSQIGVIF